MTVSELDIASLSPALYRDAATVTGNLLKTPGTAYARITWGLKIDSAVGLPLPISSRSLGKHVIEAPANCLHNNRECG